MLGWEVKRTITFDEFVYGHNHFPLLIAFVSSHDETKQNRVLIYQDGNIK